jgi:hypothetical protein
MTRTALGAALLCFGVLVLCEPTQAAQAPRTVFRAPAIPSIRPAPVRPRAIPRPAAPRAFHPGPKPKLQVHRKKPHRFARHRLPRLGFLPAVGVTVIGVAPLIHDEVEPEAEQPSGPAIARTGSAVGCEMEDAAVPGGKTITIIRC